MGSPLREARHIVNSVAGFFLDGPNQPVSTPDIIMEFPTHFRTRRLMLTRWRASDRDDLLRMHQDAPFRQALGGVSWGEPDTLAGELARDWERHGYGWWVARDPDNGGFLGVGGLRPVAVAGSAEAEIGFAFLPQHRGQGFATELARVAVAQGFVRSDLREIGATCCAENSAALRVMDKVGFSLEREVLRGGMPHFLYRLTVECWRAGPDKAPGGRGRESAGSSMATVQ